MLMGFPVISFRLCDFWAIHEEIMEKETLRVSGSLPGGGKAIALFHKQAAQRGSWPAYSLKEV